jgi:hypothetical protein
LPRSTPFPIAALILVCLVIPCASQDLHLTQDPAQKLYSTSPFAHGYRHGYEQGYHYGDLDLQLSHAPQNVKSFRQFKAAASHYKKDFGDRGSFISGYESGFRVGYADAMEGLEFRAVLNMRELSKELPEVDRAATPVLNEAITRGYGDGVKSGLNDGRTSADYRPDGSDCELALRFKEPPAKFFCNVYSLGYRLGYSDGFHNQHPKPVERRVAGEQ